MPEQHLEAGLGIDTAHHFDDEIEESRKTALSSNCLRIGPVGEKMLDPWPAVADKR